MTESRIISFIHEVRMLDRRWRNLTKEQRRAVLAILGEDADTQGVLKAIAKVRRSGRD